MTDSNGTEFVAYGNNQSKDAIAARKALAPEVQLALVDVIDELCEDPRQFPQRTRSISRDGNVLVYQHPEPQVEITFEVDEKERQIYFVHYASAAVNVRTKVFISYSHEDKDWLKRLRKWLKPLEKTGAMDFWDDSRIDAGTDWKQEIRDAMSSAKLAILLVSQDFLSSEFISTEELEPILQSAEEDGVTILWIAVSASTVEDTPIARFQAVNNPKQPLDTLEKGELNQKLKEIYETIKQTVN